MPVYVDNFNAHYGRMQMCHMVADSTLELLDMADKIGVSRKWLQYPGEAKEHFDICISKKKLAIKLGAIEMTARELAPLTIHRLGPNSPIKQPAPASTLF